GLVGGDRQAHGHSGGQGAQGAVDRAGADLAGDTDRRRGGLAPWGLHRRPHGGLAGRRGDCGEPEGVHQPGAAHADAARRARDQDALRAGGWIGTHAGGGWAELPGDAREDSADRSQGAAQAAPPQPQPQVEGICGWREGRLSRSRKTSRRTNPSNAPHLSIEMWGFSLTTPSIHYRRQSAPCSADSFRSTARWRLWSPSATRSTTATRLTVTLWRIWTWATCCARTSGRGSSTATSTPCTRRSSHWDTCSSGQLRLPSCGPTTSSTSGFFCWGWPPLSASPTRSCGCGRQRVSELASQRVSEADICWTARCCVIWGWRCL